MRLPGTLAARCVFPTLQAAPLQCIQSGTAPVLPSLQCQQCLDPHNTFAMRRYVLASKPDSYVLVYYM